MHGQKHAPGPEKSADQKLQFKQAVIIAIITTVTTLIPSILKFISDSAKITQLEDKITQLEGKITQLEKEKKYPEEQIHPGSVAGLYGWRWNTNDGWSVNGSI